MKKEFNKEYMMQNCGCYSQEQLSGCSFMKSDSITIESILESEIRLKDKFWFVVKKTELTARQKQKIAIGCAEIVLEIHEKKYPDNKAPRKAIQAAKDYLSGVIDLDALRKARAAAYAAAYAYADAAAYAADAAAAAAAYAYADAAAYAADAAYAYADAAAYAADAAAAAKKKTFTEILHLYLIDFVSRH